MSNSLFSSLHDEIPKTDVESFFWRRIFYQRKFIILIGDLLTIIESCLYYKSQPKI